MFYIYEKRVVIKVMDGSVTKYLVMVRRSTSTFGSVFMSWCPLTPFTNGDGYIDSFREDVQFLYTKDELKKMLSALPDEHYFEPSKIGTLGKEQFEKWIMNGVKTAKTIEEDANTGNRLFITWKFRPEMGFEEKYIKNGTLLIEMDSALRRSPPHQLTISFNKDKLITKKKPLIEDDFYIIKAEAYSLNCLLTKMRRNHVAFASNESEILRFPSDVKALDYCQKYYKRLGQTVFEVLHVKNKKDLSDIMAKHNIDLANHP